MEPLRGQGITEENFDAMTANFDEIDSRCHPCIWDEPPVKSGIERRTRNLGLIIPAQNAIGWAQMLTFNFEVVDRVLREARR